MRFLFEGGCYSRAGSIFLYERFRLQISVQWAFKLIYKKQQKNGYIKSTAILLSLVIATNNIAKISCLGTESLIDSNDLNDINIIDDDDDENNHWYNSWN